MLIRTHLAITVLAILLFIPHISAKILFVIVALATTFLPDIDNAFSTLGQHKIFRFLQFFTKHRGLLHSFTFCIIVSVLFALFIPSITFAFFLAYALHLFADSFTIIGIVPFWPLKGKSAWKVKTGGRIEVTIFVFFVVLDFLVFAFLIF